MHIYEHTCQNKIPENNIMTINESFKCFAYEIEYPRICPKPKRDSDDADDDDKKKDTRTFIHSSVHLSIHQYWIDRLFAYAKLENTFFSNNGKLRSRSSISCSQSHPILTHSILSFLAFFNPFFFIIIFVCLSLFYDGAHLLCSSFPIPGRNSIQNWLAAWH